MKKMSSVSGISLAALLAVAFLTGSVRAEGIRGYSLDISRCKVPKMETVFRIVDILAKLKFNRFAFYIEHTFAYSKHKTVWEEASPMTAEEIRAIDDYCHARGIEFGPDQQTFAHMERWLKHPEYVGLAEFPEGGCEMKALWLPEGKVVWPYPSCLCPTDPKVVDFIAGLLDEMLPCYRSRLVALHADETVELYDIRRPYRGRSAEEIGKKGSARVYIEYLKKIQDLCAARGCQSMFDGDIALSHPEMIGELPKDSVYTIWNFEVGYPFAEKAAQFAKAGLRYLFICSTCDWNTLFGRIRVAKDNIDGVCAARNMPGCIGCQIDSYGDGGTPQPWIVNIPPLVYFSHRVQGEEMSQEQLVAAIDELLGCKCGEALLAYGSLLDKIGGRTHGGSELYWILEDGKDWTPNVGVEDEKLFVTEASKDAMLEYGRYAKTLADLSNAPEWVKDDFALMDLLFRAVEMRLKEPGKKNFKACFEAEYRRLWRKSNRIGGLAESVETVFGKP